MKVFLYALSTCFYCQKAKKFFKENNVDFEYVDVDLQEGEEKQKLIDEVMKLTGDVKFPVMKIDDKHLVGFNEEKLKELLF
ncbi:MAG: NrdH-redoxin [Desulfitibacter sp. BRH_c19]|nr:MAG: NrdH-redoxin [Desulfitibacter sp. BRH_c19]